MVLWCLGREKFALVARQGKHGKCESCLSNLDKQDLREKLTFNAHYAMALLMVAWIEDAGQGSLCFWT